MYEKCFSKTIATIATLQVNQLVFSYLSMAIRAFSIITYCHLLPPIATLGRKTGDSQRKSREILIVFDEKHLKSGEKGLRFRTFFVFLQPTGKIPADST